MLNQQFRECVEACLATASVCRQCAVDCLQESDIQMLTNCIQTNLECAIICEAAANVMNLDGIFSEQICQFCAAACERCADICEVHALNGMEHCRICMEECRRCMNMCIQMISV